MRTHRGEQDRARVEADKMDTARPVDVLQGEKHSNRRRLVDGEDALKVRAEAIEQVLSGALRRLPRRARVLIRGDELNSRILCFELPEKARLPILRARGAFGVAQQQRFSLPSEQLSQAIGGECAAFSVVGSDKADNRVRLETGIDDHRRHARALRLLHRSHQTPAVQRREDDALHAFADETLHDLDLLLAVIFANRALPDQGYRIAGRRKLALRAHGSRVDRLPELMCRALRNNGDLQRFPVRARCGAASVTRAAAGDRNTEHGRHGDTDKRTALHRAPCDASSSTTTVAIVLGGTAGRCSVRPVPPRSTLILCLSASKYARAGTSLIPVSSSRPSFGQSKMCA